jgi:uncharacterized protein YdaU (DUF1376 family)
MSKDPAFLFYYQDFLVGTDHMTNEQVGQYVRLLCHQANRGSIRCEHMKKICQRQSDLKVVGEKFHKNEKGEFYNERLRIEVEKRRKYSESRSKNRQLKP